MTKGTILEYYLFETLQVRSPVNMYSSKNHLENLLKDQATAQARPCLARYSDFAKKLDTIFDGKDPVPERIREILMAPLRAIMIGPYEGRLDYVDSRIAEGWAINKDLGSPLRLELTVNGIRIGRAINSDLFRKDLQEAGYSNGAHGFRKRINLVLPMSARYFWCLRDVENRNLINFGYYCPYEMSEQKEAQDINWPCSPHERILIDKLTASNLPEYLIVGIEQLSKNDNSYHPKKYPLCLSTEIFDLPEIANNHRNLIKNYYTSSNMKMEDQLRDALLCAFLYLLKREQSPVLREIYDNFLANETDSGGGHSFRILPRPRILLVAIDKGMLSYYSSVFANIPPYMADILVLNPPYPTSLELDEMGLGLYNFKCGFYEFTGYNACVVDPWYYYCNKNVRKLADVIERIIFLPHAVYGIGLGFKRSFGLIVTSTTAAQSALKYEKSVYMNASTPDDTPKGDSCLSEIAVTGPFHLGKYASPDKVSKNKLRSELISELGIEAEPSLPWLYFIEDSACNSSQLSRLINILSDHCVVMVKAYIGRSKLTPASKPNIIMLDPLLWACNRFRMSADYVMAGIYGSSSLTALMQGLPLICYYTRITKLKDPRYAPQLIRDKIIDEIQRGDTSPHFFSFYRFFPWFFDALDPEAILKAIFESDYLMQYKSNLKLFQKLIFGDYILDGADEKTAQLIIRYASLGSFGEDSYRF